jgi:hypothetical protein
MTDQSNSPVGQPLVDAYLDSIEQALIAAHAPRSDRAQVLLDLESQISDMLAQQPLPRTEETVQAIIQKLEPPSHFAATYGNGDSKPATPQSFKHLLPNKFHWPHAAVVSCACLPLSCLLFLIAVNTPPHWSPVTVLLLIALLTGFLFTPIALWKSRQELRGEPLASRDRDWVLKSATVYGVLAPALLMAFFTVATHGRALIPFGVVAFVYLQYLLIGRLRRYMRDETPEVAPVGTTAPAAAL